MFGIGTTELIVVAVLALLLFSPRELPKMLKSVAQFWGSIRRTADEFKDAIMQEDAMQDIKDAYNGTKAQLRDAEAAARREVMKARMEARRAENRLVKVAREREKQEREAQASAEPEPGAGEGTAAEGTAADGADKPSGEGAATAAPQGTVASRPGAGTGAPGSVDPRHSAAAAKPAESTPSAGSSSRDADKPKAPNQGAA